MVLLFALITNAFALTNSQPALESYWNANIQIKAEAWDPESQDTVPGFCNATFLSKQVLVTAAHCVAQAQAMGKFQIEIQAGEYKYVTRPDGQVVRVGYATKDRIEVQARFEFLPSLAQRIQNQGVNVRIGPEEDVAIIRLAQPWNGVVQMSYPKVLPKEKEQLLRGNIANKMVVTTINFMEVMTNDTKQNALLNVISNQGPYFQSNSHSRVQEGDSGSALYFVEGNQYYLVGVVKGRAETFFSDWDVYTNAIGLLRSAGF